MCDPNDSEHPLGTAEFTQPEILRPIPISNTPERFVEYEYSCSDKERYNLAVI